MSRVRDSDRPSIKYQNGFVSKGFSLFLIKDSEEAKRVVDLPKPKRAALSLIIDKCIRIILPPRKASWDGPADKKSIFCIIQMIQLCHLLINNLFHSKKINFCHILWNVTLMEGWDNEVGYFNCTLLYALLIETPVNTTKAPRSGLIETPVKTTKAPGQD